MGFIDEIKAKAKSCKKTIVLPVRAPAWAANLIIAYSPLT